MQGLLARHRVLRPEGNLSPGRRRMYARPVTYLERTWLNTTEYWAIWLKRLKSSNRPACLTKKRRLQQELAAERERERDRQRAEEAASNVVYGIDFTRGRHGEH